MSEKSKPRQNEASHWANGHCSQNTEAIAMPAIRQAMKSQHSGFLIGSSPVGATLALLDRWSHLE
jgi:hypothetical protein